MDTSTVPRSWQDAFERHSIPEVRAFEKRLLASVTRDKEKLRVLVGGNYRELLSTAEEIVVLDRKSREAESSISELSQQCKPPSDQTYSAYTSNRASPAAQLRLLIQCLSCASSALRINSLLTAAQLAVISRLLLKSISEQENPPKLVEQLRTRITSLNHAIPRKVHARLIDPSSSSASMVTAISAYCLFTSASTSDALKHFRSLRVERLRQPQEGQKSTKATLLEYFRYFVNSVESLKTLCSRATNDAITSLQKQPIFDDPIIKGLESLDISKYRNLVPRDISSFTPYIKRVSLSPSEVDEMVKVWSTEAAEVLVKRLSAFLKEVRSLDDTLALRKEILRTLLQDYFSIGAPETALAAIRQCLNSRIKQLCRSKIEVLNSIAEKLISIDSSTASQLLWEPQMTQKQFGRNSANYCYQVQARHHGTDGELHSLLKKLLSWSNHVSKIREHIESLRSVRWQDIIEEPDEDEEDHVREIINSLTKEDPQNYATNIDTALGDCIINFENVIDSMASQASDSSEPNFDDPSWGKALLSLRLIRESTIIVRRVVPKVEFEKLNALVPRLHEKIAKLVLERFIASCETEQKPNSRLLASVEDLPSPRAFLSIQKLCSIMSEIGGSDIWSPAAVRAVTSSVSNHVFEEAHLQRYTVNEFDQYYLRAALGARKAEGGEETDATKKRQASACWSRNRAMFGVLCP